MPKADEIKQAELDRLRSQRSLLHAIKRELGMQDKDYRAMLENFMLHNNIKGDASSKSLPLPVLKSLITALQAQLPEGNKYRRTKTTKYTGSGAKGFAKHLTQRQAAFIEGLEKELGWDTERTNRFIKRQTGKQKSVSMLSALEATKLIIGMQQVLADKQKETA